MISLDSAVQEINKYRPGIRVIHDVSAEPAFMLEMPSTWAAILFANERERISTTINVWKQHFGYEHSSLISCFKSYLKAVFLAKYGQQYSLIYALGDEKDTFYYEGRNPLTKCINTSVQPHWHKLPLELRRFYDTLHNGWCHLPSDSMGLVPAENFLLLDDLEWGILDEIDITFDLQEVVAVFHNGAGGYVCLDVSKSPISGLLWWHDAEPDTAIDFWPTVDEWTVIGVEMGL